MTERATPQECGAVTPSPSHLVSGSPGHLVTPVEAPVSILREVVRRFGTPTYAYDLGRIRTQAASLRACFPPAVEILYSLKANASLGLCGVLADCGLGADVASAGELITALAAGFSGQRIFVTGPDKSPAICLQMRSVPEAIVSLDSVSELTLLAEEERPRRVLLRLRPDFRCNAVLAAGAESRHGLLFEELPRCRDYLAARGTRVVGFHVYAGSQVLDAAAVALHLSGGLELSCRAADVLGIAPEIIDLGGGFGIPYGPEDRKLDLDRIGEEVASIAERAAPAQLVLELGRFLVAQSGWYLTTVLGGQTHAGRRAVVVDGGTHQRGDMCNLGLRRKAFPPVPLDSRTSSRVPTDILGCLSHPCDVLAEGSPLPALSRGDVLAFPNAGAYGLQASVCLFHCHLPPAEVAFEKERLELLRIRKPASAVLEGQARLNI